MYLSIRVDESESTFLAFKGSMPWLKAESWGNIGLGITKSAVIYIDSRPLWFVRSVRGPCRHQLRNRVTKKREKEPKVGPPAHEIDLSAAIPEKETSNWLFHVFSIDGIKLRLWWQRAFFFFSGFSHACPSQIKYDFISGPGFPSAQPLEVFRWLRWHFGWSLGKHSVSK